MNTSSPLLINLPHPYTPPHVHRKRKPPEWFLNSLTSVVPVTLCPSRLHWTCQSTHHGRGQKRLNAPRQAVFFLLLLFVCLFVFPDLREYCFISLFHLAVQGTLQSLLQQHSSKASIRWCSAFFKVELSHPHMTTGNAEPSLYGPCLVKWCLCLFIQSRFVIAVLSRRKYLNFISAVTVCSHFGALQNKVSLFPLFLHLFAMEWWDWMPFSSVQFSHSIMSNSLLPHGLQHTRPPCPSPTARVYSNSCSLSQWCHPTISFPWPLLS